MYIFHRGLTPPNVNRLTGSIFAFKYLTVRAINLNHSAAASCHCTDTYGEFEYTFSRTRKYKDIIHFISKYVEANADWNVSRRLIDSVAELRICRSHNWIFQ